MNVKEIHVSYRFLGLKQKIMTIVIPILAVIQGILGSLELLLESILLSITAVLNIALYGNPTRVMLSVFTDFDEKVKAAVKEAKKPIEEMEAILERIRKGVQRLLVNLPTWTDQIEPYIDAAIFGESNYKNIQLYHLAASHILEEMNLLFSDIVFQLSSQKAKTMEATLHIFKNISDNIQGLHEQVSRGTF